MPEAQDVKADNPGPAYYYETKVTHQKLSQDRRPYSDFPTWIERDRWQEPPFSQPSDLVNAT
jgi:hypothetical protein